MNTGETIALIKAFGNGGGGSSLPSVTSSDNGKVLTVDDGAWAADNNTIIVTVSGGVARMKGSEIVSAVSAGKQVLLNYHNKVFVLCGYNGNTAYFAVREFTAQDMTYMTNTYEVVKIASNGTVSSMQNILLPQPLNASDYNGYVPIVANGNWVFQPQKFIVTLTPTALDYSGTMDKTVAEINAAYEAGQEIVFKLQTSASSYIEVPVQLVGHDTTLAYPSFETSVVQSSANLQVFASTLATDDGTKQTYGTTIYSLTPAS